MTLEETLSNIAALLETGRKVQWLLGDMAAEACIAHGGGDKKAIAAIIGQIASTARRSAASIRQLIAVSMEFPAELRYPDVEWSIFRAVRLTAKRIGREAADVLKEAVDNEYSLADLAALGKDPKRQAELKRICDECGAEISIKVPGELAGLRVECLVCKALERDGVQLGVLEVK
jgi:hypothetical protein